MKTTAEKIAVMQAHEDGKMIEFTTHNGSWHEIPNPNWNWENADYRVKTEPREWLVRLDENGILRDTSPAYLGTKRVFKVREVLE